MKTKLSIKEKIEEIMVKNFPYTIYLDDEFNNCVKGLSKLFSKVIEEIIGEDETKCPKGGEHEWLEEMTDSGFEINCQKCFICFLYPKGRNQLRKEQRAKLKDILKEKNEV